MLSFLNLLGSHDVKVLAILQKENSIGCLCRNTNEPSTVAAHIPTC